MERLRQLTLGRRQTPSDSVLTDKRKDEQSVQVPADKSVASGDDASRHRSRSVFQSIKNRFKGSRRSRDGRCHTITELGGVDVSQMSDAMKKARTASLPAPRRDGNAYEPKLLEQSPRQPGKNRYVQRETLLTMKGGSGRLGVQGGGAIELFEAPSLDDLLDGERRSEAVPPDEILSSVETPIYDTAAVQRAFGPLRDVGRWYSHEQERRRIQQQMRMSRYSQPYPLPAGSAREANDNGTKSGFSTSEEGDEVVYTRVGPCFDPSPGQARSLAFGLKNLAFQGWYWGPLTRQEAEEKLEGTSDGTFLVRDSSDDRYLLSLSFRSQGRTLHTRIEFYNSQFSFYQRADTEGHSTVVELIEKSVCDSRDGILCYSRGRGQTAPAYPVRLTNALSRFNRVRSLQHHCRFVVRQLTRFDLIRQLPLPNGMKDYLEATRF
ncbi:uncharacterized protein LOC134178596 [Corticium candelabrum]|uniref:uncharacterized protein LOC134178596 n=1 Tax=Corticium candelabrum TaxID=121492 RepID=UPI002E25A3E1|nr:uncharacterized protein LOC134178596 [Corticium candelabrum]